MLNMCAKRKLINVIWQICQTFKNISREHTCCCGKQRGEAAQVEAHYCFFCNQQGFPSLFYLSDGRGATRGGGLPPFRLPLRRSFPRGEAKARRLLPGGVRHESRLAGGGRMPLHDRASLADAWLLPRRHSSMLLAKRTVLPFHSFNVHPLLISVL